MRWGGAGASVGTGQRSRSGLGDPERSRCLGERKAGLGGRLGAAQGDDAPHRCRAVEVLAGRGQRLGDGAHDLAGVLEPDLGLGGVHVHVDGVQGELQRQVRLGLESAGRTSQGAVDRPGQEAVPHHPAVDRDDQLVACPGGYEEAGDLDRAGAVAHRLGGASPVGADEIRQAMGGRAGGRELQELASAVLEAKGHLGVGEGEGAKGDDAVTQLGALGCAGTCGGRAVGRRGPGRPPECPGAGSTARSRRCARSRPGRGCRHRRPRQTRG